MPAAPFALISKTPAPKGFIVTKKGRQIYADERCLIDFVRRKFADAPEHMNGTP
jgi:hypothetical protein